MVTCHLRYIIDPYKLAEFEHYGKLWIPLVEKFGGSHHGYFLPSEGANNVAYAMFTFPAWRPMKPIGSSPRMTLHAWRRSSTPKTPAAS